MEVRICSIILFHEGRSPSQTRTDGGSAPEIDNQASVERDFQIIGFEMTLSSKS